MSAIDNGGAQVLTAQETASLRTELAHLRLQIAEFDAAATARKQLSDELRASETRYRRLFEAAQDGIFILDADTGEPRPTLP
jgi:PAS domain-containing protein